MASDVADIHDIDLEVYGTKIDDVTATTTSTITSYNFEVCTIQSQLIWKVLIANTINISDNNFAQELISFNRVSCNCLKKDFLKIIAVFQFCDSILNVGPCGHVAMGQPSFLSEELQSTSKAEPDVELVSTSGHEKNGALF